MPTLIVSASSGSTLRLPPVSQPSGPSFHLSWAPPRTHEPQGTFLMPSWEYALLGDLRNDFYDLTSAVIIEIEYSAHGVIARYNPIDMYGEGQTREEAIKDLASSIVAYYECLIDAGEEHLGPLPYTHWQRLSRLITRGS